MKNLEKLSRGELLLRAEAATEIKRRHTENRIAYYHPHRLQERFHKSQATIRIFLGGNGSGKSTAGAAEASWASTGKHPYLQYRTPSRGRIATTSFDKIEQVIIPQLEAWIPKRAVEDRKKNNLGIYTKWWLKNGTYFDILSYQQDVEEYEGVDLDWFWADEPIPKDRYQATIARFRRVGRIWMTLTPLTEPWILDDLVNQADGKYIDIMKADIMDNCLENGGYLTKDAIDLMLKGYDEDEIEARAHGNFIFLQGLIYKSFDRAIHVIEPFEIPKDWTTKCVVDPHDRRPFAISWQAISPAGDVFIYDEWPEEDFHKKKSCDLTIEDYAKLIKVKEGNHDILKRLIDPNFGNTINVHTKSTVKEDFESLGIDFYDANNDIQSGHLKVKEYLKYDKTKPISNTNKPKLFIFDTCKNHIYGLTHYVWDEFKDRSKDPKQKPKDMAKDFPDCIRYGLMDIDEGYALFNDGTLEYVKSKTNST